LSRLMAASILEEKVMVGECREDIAKDLIVEGQLLSLFPGLNVITNVGGRKSIPVQGVHEISERLSGEKEQAVQMAFEEGYAKGLAEGRREAKKVLDDFATLARDVIKERERLYEEAKGKILELVMGIARKVTFDTARLDHKVTSGIISGIINELTDKSKIKIKVHPEHLAKIKQDVDSSADMTSLIKDFAIEPDEGIRFGGCMIETPNGEIDGRVDSQIEILFRQLSGNEADN